MPQPTTRQTLHLLTVLVLSVSLTGCAVVKPFVGPVQTTTPPPSAYPAVVELADSLRDEVVKKRMGLHQFEFWSGATLIGVGLASAGLGLYGGTHDALIGTALGGGAVVAGRTYVPIKTRQGIYNDALAAIEKAKTDTLEIKAQAVVAIAAVAPMQLHANPALDANYVYLSMVMSAAKDDAESLRRQVVEFNDPANRAAMLLTALKNVVSTANKALVDEVLDPTAALAAATRHIDEARQRIEQGKKTAEESTVRLKLLKDAYALTAMNIPGANAAAVQANLNQLDVSVRQIETTVKAVEIGR